MEKENNQLSARSDAEGKLRIWGPGEWVNEPDFHKFIHREVACRVCRGPGGSLCGYLHVKPGHPWYKRHYMDDGIYCYAHGGLTFSEEDENGDWVIGFDCSHCDDLVPQMKSLLGMTPLGEKTYRNLEFVTLELHRLVDQYLEAANEKSR